MNRCNGVRVHTAGFSYKAIYLDEMDRVMWLDIVYRGLCVSAFNWRCHVWVQMDSRYHLAVEAVEVNYSKGMCQLNGAHTKAHSLRNFW